MKARLLSGVVLLLLIAGLVSVLGPKVGPDRTDGTDGQRGAGALRGQPVQAAHNITFYERAWSARYHPPPWR